MWEQPPSAVRRSKAARLTRVAIAAFSIAALGRLHMPGGGAPLIREDGDTQDTSSAHRLEHRFYRSPSRTRAGVDVNLLLHAGLLQVIRDLYRQRLEGVTRRFRRKTLPSRVATTSIVSSRSAPRIEIG